MLVLSRKKNESIVINNDITIVVVEIRGDKVRLGVEAPKEVPVHRREVYDAIKRNAAVQNGGTAPGGPATTDAGSNTAAQS
jgi:carbon storage regulator